MRIDARVPPHKYFDWVVWHAERCCQLRTVVWVDDETHKYGQHDILTPPFPIITKQAKRILILPDQKTVIINPIEDGEKDERVHPQPQPVLAELDA